MKKRNLVLMTLMITVAVATLPAIAGATDVPIVIGRNANGRSGQTLVTGGAGAAMSATALHQRSAGSIDARLSLGWFLRILGGVWGGNGHQH